MMRAAKRWAPMGIALAVLLSGSSLAGAPVEELNDSVHLTDNSATNVRIVEDDWKGVKIKPRVGKSVDLMAFAVSRVRSTEYGNRVAQFDQGMDALRKSEYDDAIKKLRKGLSSTRDPNQKQYFQAGLVACYEGKKELVKMRAEIRKLIPANHKKAPRLIYDVFLKLGGSLLREGSYAEAEKAYKEAYDYFKKLEGLSRKEKALPGVVDYIRGYRLKAGYWKIYCMEQQGKKKIAGRDGARRAYDLFAFESTGNLRLVNLSKIGRARCDAALGKVEDAVKGLEKLLKDLTAPKLKGKSEALPAVLVALGDVAFIGLDYRKARWYYLTVIVQHSTDRATVARAHYMAGTCYEKLRETAREREALPRALRHYSIVTREFKDSLEYAEAMKKLKALKARMGA